jgi:hypothetical protein
VSACRATLLDDPVVGQVRELRLELPYDLPFENYQQILDDFVSHIAPEPGWLPEAARNVDGHLARPND